MYGGGLDREELDLLTPDGNRDLDTTEESLGCHVGEFAGMNVFHYQSGFVYSWANDNARSRLRVRQRGGQIVQGEDPEFAAYNAMVGHDHTPVDSSQTGYPGVILVRTPVEIERQRRAEEAQRRQSLMRGGVAEEAYTARGLDNPGEKDYRERRGFPNLRFKRDDHMSRVTTGPQDTDNTVDAWTPGSGIVRE